ncbi:MAG: tetratricopeptide repeat protein [Anaerolineae bacterium]|jgi:tetratricopeptide (TPR) repeat protein|nr:tetratricopeptide repeat protein [Anaerolineae bacterium]MBT7188793.1 tetratricopeptide repeat protein [Anaerolineae bacterium]
MGIKQKTVFISYRRTNFYTALAVYQDLHAHGYDVFFDYESIDSGDFEQIIFENIQHRAHFLVILSPSSLERLKEANSIMRREVEMAVDEGRNIIPLTMEGFDFGNHSSKEAFFGKLANLSSYNAVGLVPEYFDAGMEKLRRFLDIALEDVRLPALSAITEEDTEKRQAKASEEPAVEEKSLTAEEWFERGYKSQIDGNHKGAIRCYEEVLRINPNHPEPYNNLGNILVDLKRYAEAEEAYRKAIKIDPEYAVPYRNLGDLFAKLKRPKKAEESYRKAIKIDPEDDMAYSSLGDLFDKLKRSKEAIIHYNKAIQLRPNFEPHYYFRGKIYRKQGNFQAAIADHDKAIQLFPESQYHYALRGEMHGELRDFQAAITDYSNAIQFAPDNAHYYSLRGEMYGELGDFQAAITDYSNAIQFAPDDAHYYSLRGEMHEKLEEFQAAIADYNAAIENSSGYPLHLHALFLSSRGIVRKKQEDFHNADIDFGKAIRFEPKDAYYLYLRGDIREKQGNLESAATYYSHAIQIDPYDAYYYFRRGLLQNKRGKILQAIRDYTIFTFLYIKSFFRKTQRTYTDFALEENIRIKKKKKQIMNEFQELLAELEFIDEDSDE